MFTNSLSSAPAAAEVVAAYDAPFPDDTHTDGAQVFPTLVPTGSGDAAAVADAVRRHDAT